MINKDYLNTVKNLSVDYSRAAPFPSIVLDNFLEDETLKEVVPSLESQVNSLPWYEEESGWWQIKKKWIPDPNTLPAVPRKVLNYLNSSEMLQFLEILTGIRGLIADPTNFGGGVHCTSTGGSLAIHKDFNYDKSLKLHRRINVLLFLNEDWSPDWGGDLELWNTDRTSCIRKISPIFNRMACFSITDDAYHGFPHPITCPDSRKRYSFATYYYTEDRPEKEISEPHTSHFYGI